MGSSTGRMDLIFMDSREHLQGVERDHLHGREREGEGGGRDARSAINTLCTFALSQGAQLYIPKALQFDRHVAGQIPTGWDARRYGVPEDIVQQVT